MSTPYWSERAAPSCKGAWADSLLAGLVPPWTEPENELCLPPLLTLVVSDGSPAHVPFRSAHSLGNVGAVLEGEVAGG